MRRTLTAEAIQLGYVLVRLMPDEPETAGLLALMLPHKARSGARTGPGGALVTLEEQDHGRWDAARIDEGTAAAGPGPRIPPAARDEG